MIEVMRNCTGCGICIKHCPFGVITIHNNRAQIGEACTLCSSCVRICPVNAIKIERKKMTSTDLSQYKGVWVFVEQYGYDIRKVTLELLSKGRELADKLDEELSAILLGTNVTKFTTTLAAYGVDKIYLAEHEVLEDYNADSFTDILTGAIVKYKPAIFLFGATIKGRELAPCVAARLRIGLTADCTGLEVDKDRQLIQIRPAFGGNIMASIVSRTRPQMATVRPNVMKIGEPDWTRTATIEQLTVELTSKAIRAQILDSVEETTTATLNIEEAAIIISGGRGLGSPNNLQIIEKLAEALGAAVGGSRPIVDSGWMPHQQQVGQSGKTVSPKLYIAIGISGVIQHIIGMRTSDIIIAINKDPEAPIFNIATYGVVGDLFKIVPALTQEIHNLSRKR
jgi:electron transfer flavoprotein alpha subunit